MFIQRSLKKNKDKSINGEDKGIIAFDEGERTLIEKNSSFYGLYDVGNLAPPENFSGANDVSAMPCASAPRASLSLRVSCRTHSTNR